MEKSFIPYRLMAIGGLLLFIFSLLGPHRPLDIHIHDAYFVMDTGYLASTLATALLSLFALSYLLKSFLASPALSRAHVVLTLMLLGFLLLFSFLAADAYRPGFNNWKHYYHNNRIIQILLLLLTASQLLYLTNIISGILKKYNERKDANG